MQISDKLQSVHLQSYDTVSQLYIDLDCSWQYLMQHNVKLTKANIWYI